MTDDQYGDPSPASPYSWNGNGDEDPHSATTTAEPSSPAAAPPAPAEPDDDIDVPLDSFAQLAGDTPWGIGVQRFGEPTSQFDSELAGQPPAQFDSRSTPRPSPFDSGLAAPTASQLDSGLAAPPEFGFDSGLATPPQPLFRPPAAPAPEQPAVPTPQPGPAAEARRKPPTLGQGAPAPDDRGYENPQGVMQTLLRAVLEQQASDLHLIAGTRPLLRVHGDLEEVKGWQRLRPQDIESLIDAILPESHRQRFQEEMELDFAYSMPQSARFRVNIYRQRGSIAGAFRIIPCDILSVGELGLPLVVSDLARHRRGLVVVTGPTGSGKSTTLAAMVDIVNRERSAHILTVEDPIEFLHEHGKSAVCQREVGPDTQGFAPALKHALRQDPDVILVGEMRDLETMSTAITAAETGHLVFATLHTQDAPQAIDRLIDVFPPSQQQQIRIQLAITLQGVVAQQLLPTADGQGRVVAAEVLVVTPAVRNLIREGKTHQIYSAMQAGRKFGMVTMDAALAELTAMGKISEQTAVQHASNIDEFQRLMSSPAPTAIFGQ